MACLESLNMLMNLAVGFGAMQLLRMCNLRELGIDDVWGLLNSIALPMLPVTDLL